MPFAWLAFFRKKAAAPKQLANLNVLSERQKKRLRRANARAGLRELPFPFGSAIAVVSDVDASSRAKYDAYVGLLVDQLGLDFGDSIWLRWRFAKAAGGIVLGFFSRHYSLGHTEESEQFNRTHTFFESLAEYHAGNVDHFHSFLSRGPRVAIGNDISVKANVAEIAFREFEDAGPWNCVDVFVVAICAVSRPGTTMRPQRIHVYEGDKVHEYCEYGLHPGTDRRERHIFVHATLGRDDATIPELSSITKVVLEFADPADSSNLETVFLLDGYGPVLLNRLAVLRDVYNVEIQLITEHAGRHFRGPRVAEEKDAALRAHLQSAPRATEAYNGTLNDDSGGLQFSTDADEPGSFGRVLPELCDDFEVRFLHRQGARRRTGWDPFDIVTPLPTRTGAKIYEVRRMSPPHAPDKSGARMKNTQATFAARLAVVLADTKNQSGSFWPIYTHLGGIKQQSDGDQDDTSLTDAQERRSLPSPYFALEPLHGLQDRMLNISGATDATSRLWFTRASVLYDYALMIKSVAAHVTRPDANTIAITSWTDAVLNKTLPRSPGQLYGLTFYVDEPSKARVLLDGKSIDGLLRNPADESGRRSITIAEAEIRTTLLGRVDPATNAPQGVHVTHADWSWRQRRPEERAYARVSVSSKDVPAQVRILLHGLQAKGAQILPFAARTSPGTQFALLLETQTGGRFFFGHESLLRDVAGVTAHYLFDRHDTSPDRWQVLLAPLYDLRWASGAKPGGPVPNHALEALTIIARGDVGATLDIADVACLRPRATALSTQRGRGFCLGGRIKTFTPGQRVHIGPEMGGDTLQTERVDQRGYFCFPQIPAGIYRVWSEAGGAAVHDLRGPLVEVNADRMDLVIGN